MISVVSLFSGCGGLDYGFHNDYFDLKMAYDNDKSAIDCLSHNLNAPAKVIDVTSSDFMEELKMLNNIDVVLGGFPCQGFSKAGPKKNDDPRNQLYLAMLNAVEELKPRIFLGENVDGIAQNFNGSFLSKITEDFSRIGYNVEYRILNAINFGIPQYRRRVIFIGTLKSDNLSFSWPQPTHYGNSRNGEFKTDWEVGENSTIDGIKLSPEVSIEDAIGDLLDKSEEFPDNVTIPDIKGNDLKIISAIEEGQKLCNVRFSDTSVYTWQIPSVFGETSSNQRRILEAIGKNRRKKTYGNIPNGNPLSVTVIEEKSGLQSIQEDLNYLVKTKYLKIINGKYDLLGAMFCSGLYKRPLWNQPSPTVLTLFHSPRYFIHPKKNRPLTIRECARLQSFPDSFRFLESGIDIKDAYRLIGNAVPPLLAKKLSQSVRSYFSNIKTKHETLSTEAVFQ